MILWVSCQKAPSSVFLYYNSLLYFSTAVSIDIMGVLSKGCYVGVTPPGQKMGMHTLKPTHTTIPHTPPSTVGWTLLDVKGHTIDCVLEENEIFKPW